jgi:hypothetical protein
LGGTVLEDVEQHLSAGSPLIDDVCVLPSADAVGPLDGCTVVVIPNGSELGAQEVPLPLRRMREAVHGAAATSPHPITIEGLILLEQPLPRTSDGKLDRDQIAARARDWPPGDSPDEAHDSTALKLLERLEDVLDTPGPLSLSQRFEADLGLDSLDLIQIRLLIQNPLLIHLK